MRTQPHRRVICTTCRAARAPAVTAVDPERDAAGAPGRPAIGGATVDRARRRVAPRCAGRRKSLATSRGARPSSAQTSAVSAGWTRLPAANTPGTDVRKPDVTAGAFATGHHRAAGAAGELVVGDPVAGEHDRVALDARAVGELDRLDAPATDDVGDVDAGADRHAAASGGRPAQRRRTSGGGGAGSIIAATSQPRCRSVSTAEKLTCSAPTITARRPTGWWWNALNCCERARGEHASRPVAGDEPRRAWPLAGAGGEHDGARRRRARCRSP